MTIEHPAGLVVGTGDFVYDVVRPWGELPASWRLGLVSHVAADSKDRSYFHPRKDPPVLVFDQDGHFLTAWDSQRLRDAHGISWVPTTTSRSARATAPTRRSAASRAAAAR